MQHVRQHHRRYRVEKVDRVSWVAMEVPAHKDRPILLLAQVSSWAKAMAIANQAARLDGRAY